MTAGCCDRRGGAEEKKKQDGDYVELSDSDYRVLLQPSDDDDDLAHVLDVWSADKADALEVLLLLLLLLRCCC